MQSLTPNRFILHDVYTDPDKFLHVIAWKMNEICCFLWEKCVSILALVDKHKKSAYRVILDGTREREKNVKHMGNKTESRRHRYGMRGKPGGYSLIKGCIQLACSVVQKSEYIWQQRETMPNSVNPSVCVFRISAPMSRKVCIADKPRFMSRCFRSLFIGERKVVICAVGAVVRRRVVILGADSKEKALFNGDASLISFNYAGTRRTAIKQHFFFVDGVVLCARRQRQRADLSWRNNADERVHLLFPPKGGRAAETFQSLFSYTDGKIRDGYGEDGCGRKVEHKPKVSVENRRCFIVSFGVLIASHNPYYDDGIIKKTPKSIDVHPVEFGIWSLRHVGSEVFPIGEEKVVAADVFTLSSIYNCRVLSAKRGRLFACVRMSDWTLNDVTDNVMGCQRQKSGCSTIDDSEKRLSGPIAPEPLSKRQGRMTYSFGEATTSVYASPEMALGRKYARDVYDVVTSTPRRRMLIYRGYIHLFGVERIAGERLIRDSDAGCGFPGATIVAGRRKINGRIRVGISFVVSEMPVKYRYDPDNNRQQHVAHARINRTVQNEIIVSVLLWRRGVEFWAIDGIASRIPDLRESKLWRSEAIKNQRPRKAPVKRKQAPPLNNTRIRFDFHVNSGRGGGSLMRKGALLDRLEEALLPKKLRVALLSFSGRPRPHLYKQTSAPSIAVAVVDSEGGSDTSSDGTSRRINPCDEATVNTQVRRI
ncbi:hypothetical protein GEV33_013394 [Tenebrio molitor]|uniref:Uncharacterized protein n=1 Tax=Tenebrio molitor TaxID=7067 RepID=A0A8J6H7Q5_TENMO|nr:hypothetical protein GEV33_013394 [Tenebrio molitor]